MDFEKLRQRSRTLSHFIEDDLQPSAGISWRSNHFFVESCPLKAGVKPVGAKKGARKRSGSNRVGCAIYTRARYRDLHAAFPRCRVATLICESEKSTRRWTLTLKPTSTGCGLPQIPAGTSNKNRSRHPERRRVRGEHLILRSLRIKRSVDGHYDLNAGVVLRSTSRNNLAVVS